MTTIPFLYKAESLLMRLLPLPVALGMLASLCAVFWWVPTERVQGAVQRIFYFHVPSAWCCFLAFGLASVTSAAYLWKRHRDWDNAARAAVETGMLFATAVLITGPIWARPIWGVWWTWDSRLTTMLVLWLIFAAYLLLRAFSGERDGGSSGARFAAVLAIVGTLDIPLIVFSTRLWRTVHPAVLKTSEGGSGLSDPRMITTLILCTLTFMIMFAWLWALGARSLRLDDQVALLEERGDRLAMATGSNTSSGEATV
jgi:heme exporter protein C